MCNAKEYSLKNFDELTSILRNLCVIPAPSHFEDQRAEFCKKALESFGAKNILTDEAKNVIFPYNCESGNDITVLAAHTDTVFPDTEPYPMHEDSEKIYCPGVGDNTASVTVLLMLAKYFITYNLAPKNGVMFVFNSCEEGLGNLLGTKTLMKNYGNRISRFITFDSFAHSVICDKAVGSHRYRVSVSTKGGHSFSCFGRKNAINELANIISEIYRITVPVIGDSKTTYNVGSISGGTSVNTIAQEASMLCEYRSDCAECLSVMKEEFNRIFEKAKTEDVKLEVNLIGERPCAENVNPARQKSLVSLCKSAIEEIIPDRVTSESASTDCNIPLSMGIPSVCVGVFNGSGAHTREEFVYKDSLSTGLEIAINIASKLFL